MILYNVTIGVDREIELEWLDWMREHYIPAMLKTHLFTHHEFYKVLSQENQRTASYCIQYHCPDIETFNLYLKEYAPQLTEEHQKKFDSRHVIFHTLLEKM